MGTSKKRPQLKPARPQNRTTLPQSLALARSFLVNNDQVSAEQVLSAILTAEPSEPDALHMMGALRNMQGKPDEAVVLLERAVKLRPKDAGRWNDLGLVYGRLSRKLDAMAAYQRCIDQAGRSLLSAKALDNLGRLQEGSDAAAAEQSFRLAVDMAPDFGLAWYGLAHVLLTQNRIEEGLALAEKAARLAPKSMARQKIALALVRRGDNDRAIRYFEEWRKDDPDNPVIGHHLKALIHPQSAERASDAYIEATFDNFATGFDAQLTQLGYCAPDLVCEALRQVYPQANGQLDLADAGCGTGLCGPLVRPWAKHLCGFDLSGGMLHQAKRREVYDDLQQAELVSFLDQHPMAFDVVISADTLCYFGSLYEVMGACHRAVRPGGHVIYTVEALLDGTDLHWLAPSGRYAHSLNHLASSADAAGLEVVCTKQARLRTESGKPVIGWLVTLRKP